jgi:hypothetical protein
MKYVEYLGAFVKKRCKNAQTSLVTSTYSSICVHIIILESLDGFSLNFCIWEFYYNVLTVEYWLKPFNNEGQSTWIHTCICVRFYAETYWTLIGETWFLTKVVEQKHTVLSVSLTAVKIIKVVLWHSHFQNQTAGLTFINLYDVIMLGILIRQPHIVYAT